MKRAFAWLTGEANREAVLALVTISTALLSGGWFLYDRLAVGEDGLAPPSLSIAAGGDVGDVQQAAAGAIAVQAGAGAVVTIGYTIEQHEERLARREAELRSELAGAQAADRAALLAQIDEVRRQAANAQASFETRKAELALAIARLDNIAEGLPQTRLDAARRALAAGDDGEADAIFAEVEAMEAPAVSRAAEAAFERGRIADANIRWAEATDHYAKAARLAPTYDHLFAAHAAAWRTGDFPTALSFGEELVEVAMADFGQDSVEYAAALNGHALTLLTVRQFPKAEPLFRQALAITEKALRTEHPDYATFLNNLATLLRETGRPNEAEALYRQTLAIDEKTIGREHPGHATHLNNLADLLRTTGRPTEAEPLHGRALTITEDTLGREHPDYAIYLNNLALLLRATGRPTEAEPLLRQAMAITEKALGTEHPAYATRLNNLGNLLRATDRPDEAELLYRQSLAILIAIFGEDHPNTKSVIRKLAALKANGASHSAATDGP